MAAGRSSSYADRISRAYEQQTGRPADANDPQYAAYVKTALPQMIQADRDALAKSQGRWKVADRIAFGAAAIPFGMAAGSLLAGGGGAAASSAAGASGAAASAATGAGAGMASAEVKLGLAQLLNNIFGNWLGTSKQLKASKEATNATIAAQNHAAELQKQAADDQLAYLKSIDARDYADYLSTTARDRADWEASEQRKAPFRALADSAVRTLADYIKVPGMRPAQDVPVQHWTPPGYTPPNAPVSRAMASGPAPANASGDPRAFVQSLLPQGVATPQALAAIEPQLKAQGISLQRNSAGDVRGRIYLPSSNGDPYSNPVDLVTQWGQPWSWNAGGGGGGSAMSQPPQMAAAAPARAESLYAKYSRRPSTLASFIAS